jgi:hypothetical protein
MVFSSILASVGGQVASSLVSAGLSKAFGGGGSNGAFAGGGTNFRSGGIVVGSTPALFNKKGQLTRDSSVSVSATPERQRLVQSIGDVFGRRAGEVRGLLPQVRPGFGRLTEATRQIFDSRQSKAVSDLRAAFRDARVGTSTQRFRTESAAVRDLAEAENAIQSANFLQELDLTFNLIQAASDAEFNEQNTFLQEENLLASIALQISTGQASAVNNMNQALTQLAAQNAAGAGSFAGLLGSAAGRLAEGGINEGFGNAPAQPAPNPFSNVFGLRSIRPAGGASLPVGFNFA